MFSVIESKVLDMYSEGFSKYEISLIFKKKYAIEVSNETVSNIIDSIQFDFNQWQTRPLSKCYPFVFVNCLPIKPNYFNRDKDAYLYVILAYDLKANKDILGVWLINRYEEDKIFSELKQRGIQDIFFITINNDSFLEKTIKYNFKSAIIQYNIINLINNMNDTLINEDKIFEKSLNEIYKADDFLTSSTVLEQLYLNYSNHSDVLNLLYKNQKYSKNLFKYGKKIREIIFDSKDRDLIYTKFKEIIEKKGYLEKEEIISVSYLSILKLTQQMQDFHEDNWLIVLCQLLDNSQLKARVNNSLKQ